MKKLVPLLISFVLLNSFDTQAQYYSGFDNTAEQAGWTIYRLGATDPYYKWEYLPSTFYSSPYAISHYYPVGGTSVTDDWFVSPAFDFSSGGNIDSLRHHFSGFGTPLPGDTIGIYLLQGSADPSTAFPKTLLYQWYGSNYSPDNTWTLDTGIQIPSFGGNVYIGFRYKTTNNWLDVRFDNIYITEFSSTIGLNEDEIFGGLLFPNPAKEWITIPENIQVQQIVISDVSGKVIERIIDNSKIDISHLESGIYIVTIHGERRLWREKFIKI